MTLIEYAKAIKVNPYKFTGAVYKNNKIIPIYQVNNVFFEGNQQYIHTDQHLYLKNKYVYTYGQGITHKSYYITYDEYKKLYEDDFKKFNVFIDTVEITDGRQYQLIKDKNWVKQNYKNIILQAEKLNLNKKTGDAALDNAQQIFISNDGNFKVYIKPYNIRRL